MKIWLYYAEVGQHGQKVISSDGLHVADIDSNHKDPQMCGLYAPAIYENQRVREVCIASNLISVAQSFH